MGQTPGLHSIVGSHKAGKTKCLVTETKKLANFKTYTYAEKWTYFADDTSQQSIQMTDKSCECWARRRIMIPAFHHHLVAVIQQQNNHCSVFTANRLCALCTLMLTKDTCIRQLKTVNTLVTQQANCINQGQLSLSSSRGR